MFIELVKNNGTDYLRLVDGRTYGVNGVAKHRTSKPTQDLILILSAFGIDADLRLPTVKDLHALKYAFEKAALM